ncbi:MAG: deoxycytidylate deaminase, partial [Rhodoferax sp.]|nr:deoxycytidylate deaminase [Rhodoferax sp.]
VGIRRVIYLEKKPHQARVNEASLKMLNDARVAVESLADVEPDSAEWSAALAAFIESSTAPSAMPGAS